MSALQFSVRNFGTFASARDERKAGKERLMVNYEFEFYTENCQGGPVIDGEFYQVRQGMVSLPKPGQAVQMQHPYKCYFLNIETADPELQALFDSLPELFSVWNMDEVIDHLQQMMILPSKNAAAMTVSSSSRCNFLGNAFPRTCRTVTFCKPH